MDPLGAAASLIAVVQITSAVITACYSYRQGAKAASKEVVLISDELGSLKDVLDALLRLVESGGGELGTFELLLKDGGPLIVCQEELEKLRAKLIPEEGWRKIRQSLTWPLKEEEVRKTLVTLERLKGTMMLALTADQTTLALATNEGMKDLTQLFKRHESDQNRQRIFSWLAGPDPYANHVANRKKRQFDTGKWILKELQYEKFLRDKNSFFWIYGIPGSGKTVLCSSIIEHLTVYCQNTPESALAYFYFDFNDAGKRDINSLLKSLISQLAAQKQDMPPPLLELFENHQRGAVDKAAEIENDVLLETFRNLVLSFNTVYLVFDAVDESFDVDETLEFIRTVKNWDLWRLHLLVTSRQLSEIEDIFSGIVSDSMCLQECERNPDISIFITHKLEDDKKLAKWPPDVRQHIKTKLLLEEAGMFQWVVCQLDMIKTCGSILTLRQRMLTLAKSLDDTYEQILRQIKEDHQAEVVKTLKCLTITVFPLTVTEVIDVIATNIDAIPPHFDKEGRLEEPKELLSMCSSLITNSREIDPIDITISRRSHPLNVSLRLAHASVADFLTRPNPSTLLEFRFSKLEARQFLAQTCLVYLMNPVFSAGYSKQLRKQRLKDFPFLSHAVELWPQYLKKHPGDPEDYIDPKTKDLLNAFFATSKHSKGGAYAAWVGFLIPNAPIAYIEETQPLYYAASFGLTEVVKILLDTPAFDINALGGRANATALHVAVYRDHIDVVKLLLERNADPNIPNMLSEAPIYWAVANANDGIIELLLKHGAENYTRALSNYVSKRPKMHQPLVFRTDKS